jgi:hypothetical protein
MPDMPKWPLIGSFGSNPRPFAPLNPIVRDPAQIFADALAAFNRGDHQRALTLCLQIRASDPQYFDACRVQATLYDAFCNGPAAVTAYARLIALRPDNAEVYSNGCRRLAGLSDDQSAIGICRRALILRPDFAPAHSNLSSLLSDYAFYDQALGHALTALCLKPDLPDAWYNLGVILQKCDTYHSALRAYRHAGLINVNDADALYNAGLLYLLLGDLALGFWLYEWRWFASGRQGHAHTQPLWNGDALTGKTILLHGEQGMGDIVQFLRYVPFVKSLGAQIILEIAAPLIPLVQDQVQADVIVAPGGIKPLIDIQCPLMSLPRVFGTTLTTIPTPIPYLRADTKSQERHRIIKQPGTQVTIGLCWSGNPAYLNDKMRSVPLETMIPLFTQSGFEFHVLQKDLRDGDQVILDRLNNVHVHTLADFSDTAALIAQMDMVISVDTVTAHLSGAMGCPTWVLLPSFPDWRWLLGRDDSPWYPTIRLFRRAKDDDWPDVIARVRDELVLWHSSQRKTGGP